MAGDDPAAIGYRLGRIEAEMGLMNRSLSAIGRIEERLDNAVVDVYELKAAINDREKAEAQRHAERKMQGEAAKLQSRRDFRIILCTIIVAVIGAAATILTTMPSLP